jgi:tRNA pseudouridine13 synthase
MEVYASPWPPCGARIKARTEDFAVVESLVGLEVLGGPGEGLLPLYRVEKRRIDTPHLGMALSAALKSRVSFAGMKDKKAVAVQYATPTSVRAERPSVVEGDGFRAELVGYVARPVSRGMVRSNRFRVTLRDCCPDVGERIGLVFELAKELCLPNFYGLQRFGGGGALTHRVGRAITRKRFDEAIRVLLCEPRSSDSQATRQARESLSQGRYEEGYRLLPAGQDVERMVARRLAEKPGDTVGALRAVPIRLRRLYAEAYQSYIFNRTLSLALKKGLNIASAELGDNWGEASVDGLMLVKVHGVREPQLDGAVPLVQLVGYAYRDYGSRFDRCAGEVMEQEGVAARDFYFEEMQEISVEGGFRRPHLVVRDCSSAFDGDSAVLSFTLARGQYATVLLREIVKPEDPAAQGFA